MNKAVFLDKDGTLIVDVPYNVDPARMQLYPEVPEALRRLQEAGYKLVVVSNQAGVAYGYFEETALREVEATLRRQLLAEGVHLDGFYYCPHHTLGRVASYRLDCSCRKPRPGMLRRAAEALDLDLSASWMVGDILNDVEAGNAAGCRTLLIDNGNETEWIMNEWRTPTRTVKNMLEAALTILDDERPREAMEKRGGLYEGAMDQFDRKI